MAASTSGDKKQWLQNDRRMQPAVTSLTDSTGGTVSDTLDDATASVSDDLASLAAKVNSILSTLRNAGIIAD